MPMLYRNGYTISCDCGLTVLDVISAARSVLRWYLEEKPAGFYRQIPVVAVLIELRRTRELLMDPIKLQLVNDLFEALQVVCMESNYEEAVARSMMPQESPPGMHDVAAERSLLCNVDSKSGTSLPLVDSGHGDGRSHRRKFCWWGSRTCRKIYPIRVQEQSIPCDSLKRKVVVRHWAERRASGISPNAGRMHLSAILEGSSEETHQFGDNGSNTHEFNGMHRHNTDVGNLLDGKSQQESFVADEESKRKSGSDLGCQSRRRRFYSLFFKKDAVGDAQRDVGRCMQKQSKSRSLVTGKGGQWLIRFLRRK